MILDDDDDDEDEVAELAGFLLERSSTPSSSGSHSFSSWVRHTVRSRGASDVSDKGEEVFVLTPFVLVWIRHLDA